MPKRKTSKPFTSDSSSGAARTMEELLARVGSIGKGIARGQRVVGKIVEVTSRTVVFDIGAKSEGVVVDEEYAMVRDFAKTLSVGDKVEAVVLLPENSQGQTILSLEPTAQEYGWKKFEEAAKKQFSVEARVEEATRAGLTTTAFGIPGFIPSSQLSSKLAQNPTLVVGKNLQVKVVEADRVRGKLVFSEKAVSESDVLEKQKEVLATIQVGEHYYGKVAKLVAFGVFVQIEKDGVVIDGLVHLSELSWQKVSSPAKLVKVGDEVSVVVIGKEGGRLALSIKQTQEDPWISLSDKYKVEQKVKGKVVKISAAGAYVQLAPGIEGLIHSSKTPADISIKENDEVSCFIEEVDKSKKKISLGLVLKAKPVGYK